MLYGLLFKSSNMEKFDAIILGSGQGGNPLAKKLSEQGKRVALVESEFIGGTCINYGCTPTKTLVGIAKTIFLARKAANYGITLNETVPNVKLVNDRKNDVVKSSRERLENVLLEDSNISFFQGVGSFSGYKEVRVKLDNLDNKAITADMIFINTGTHPRIPKIKGLPSVEFFTSKTIMDLEDIPDHLLIIGGGYIGLEFSQIFRRMGSQVTIIEQHPRLLSKEDDDVASMIHQVLEQEGIRIVTSAKIVGVSAVNGTEPIQIEILSQGKTVELKGSHLLVAAGDVPNTEQLDLSNTKIFVDEKGFIPVNEHLETEQAGIYALGDVKGGPAFTHVSYNDYVVLSDHLFGDKALSIDNRLVPYCLFIDPELGRIGLTEKEASEMNLDFSVAKMNTSAIARAIEIDQTLGFIKVIVENNSKKILGVAAICAGGGELMSLLQVAIIGDLTYVQLRDTMFAHPTYAEAINNLFNPIHLKLKSS